MALSPSLRNLVKRWCAIIRYSSHQCARGVNVPMEKYFKTIQKNHFFSSDMCNQSRSSGSASPSGTKRSRTHYTPKQICILEGKFAQNEFPSAEERATMATELDVKIQHIQVQ